MIWILIAIYIITLLLELPGLIKNGWRKEIVVFAVLFLISVYMGMVQFYHWPFYNPLKDLLPLSGNIPMAP
jgi:hypothetical protein